MIKGMLAFLFAVYISASAFASPGEGWHDTYYQYRLPVSVDADAPGLQAVPVSEERIVRAVNQLEDMPFNERWFAYNNVILAETDEEGKETGRLIEGGFYLAPVGDNLAENIMEAPLTHRTHGIMQAGLEHDLEPGEFYLLSYVSSNAGYSPMRAYDPIFPIGSPMRPYDYYSSYEPPLLPKARTRHERLFIPDESPLNLHMAGTWSTEIEEISVQRVEIKLLADLPEAGLNSFNLYYQPMTGHHLSVPEKRLEAMPDESARLYNISAAEKHYGDTRYLVSSGEAADIWFAETTVKITPNTPAPAEAKESIRISLAGGEAQTFQVILSPKRAVRFEGIEVSELTGAGGSLPGAEAKLLEYVPITRSSYITPVEFTGAVGDPLVEVEPRDITPAAGNLALCVTVEAGRDSAAGQYSGHVNIDIGGGTIRVPLTVIVRDFNLPEFSPFKSNVGGQFLAKVGEPGEDPPLTLDFHGLSRSTEESGGDLKKLAREYYTVMAKNRFHPKTVALYEEIGMKWDPPPEGYNVDAPGNYFRLYDWNFTDFNETLTYFIDELKVNQITLMHINPPTTNIFFHLPGERAEYFQKREPFVTMGWQAFRDMTYVAYGKREGDGYYDVTIEITRDQFDRLLLDYFRAIAQNLEEHGWLDKAYIMIDEGMDQARLHHFLSVLKSDPLTARIKVGTCMQGFEVFTHKLPESDEYAFKGLLDYYIPQADENYNRWEEYMFPDYGIEPDRGKLWNYIVYSARLCIDTPGVNHRQLALDFFNRGVSGYLIWEVFGWYEWYDAERNPWAAPYNRMGNGALSYFYPPRRDGSIPEESDFIITPSIRVLIHRQSSQDYDYAWMLESLAAEARERGIDASEAESVLEDIGKFFDSKVHWSQNDAWYLELRERMAEAITGLKSSLGR